MSKHHVTRRAVVHPDIVFLLCRTSVTCHRPTIFLPHLKHSTIPCGQTFRKCRMNASDSLSMESFAVILFHQRRQAMFPTNLDITTVRLSRLSFTVNRILSFFIYLFNCCFLCVCCWRRRRLILTRSLKCHWDLIDGRCSKSDMSKSFALSRCWRQSPEDT